MCFEVRDSFRFFKNGDVGIMSEDVINRFVKIYRVINKHFTPFCIHPLDILLRGASQS